jgi:predicted AAA+ superfamily ATPase
MSYVLVKEGSYRNQAVENTVFPLIKNFTPAKGKDGGFVTVDGSCRFGADAKKVRISVDNPVYLQFVEQDAFAKQEGAKADIVESVAPKYTQEDDEKRIEEIQERFEILDEMTGALTKSDIRAMIVTGPPGVGKSYGVEEQLSKSSLFGDMTGAKRKYEVVKGAMTALGLYAKLYEYSDKGNVLVFDDCDSVLMDDLALNILKAALDSGKKRMIYWNAESHKLNAEGIPNKFEFKGTACFITNIKFENVRSKKLQDHLEALQSRCHYLDLTLDTMRDKILRVKQIARKGDLFQDYKFSKEEEDEIIDFMTENCNKFREVSLRMALKIADLKQISPKWKALAESTCMKRV